MQRGRDKIQMTMPFGGYGHTTAGPTSTYSGSGTLPNLPVRTPGYAGGYGVRMRPASGLAPTITNVPNLGAYPRMPTVPREKPSRLSSSDSKALEALRPSSRHQLYHIRRNTTDGARLKPERQTAPPILPRPPSSQPKAMPRTLPPLPSATGEDPPLRESGSTCSSENASEDSESESSLEEESEIFSDEISEAPPSRPGFESDAEQSAQTLSIPFPEVTNPSNPFPATIIQDYAHLDMEKYAASAHVTGMSARVNNIVRAFRIHGPLDKELLSKAVNEVASLHHLLMATFQRGKDRLYMQTSQEKVSVNLESPIVGHESPQDLIINARRKIFTLPMRTDLCDNGKEGDRDAMSVVSLGGQSGNSNPPPPEETQVILQKKKSVSFARSQSPTRNIAPLPALSHPMASEITPPEVLMRARLVRKNPQEHILVLSFPSIVCDFWSSCLFMQQLVDAYSKLEKSASYRPSLAAIRIETKRQEVAKAYMRERGATPGARKGQHSRDATSRLLQKRAHLPTHRISYTPVFPAHVQFQQVARRESQLLKMVSKERLWAFWESMVTATIRRQRGPNRVKVVPPVRIPSGLGDKVVVRARPGTSRLRPLTARGRPQTAMRRQGSVFAEMGTTREALAGPNTLFHFMKIEEDVCASFRMSLPEEYLACINTEEVLSLMCLGAYVLMLGKCCRGWGAEVREQGDGASGSQLNEDSFRIFPVIPQAPQEQRRFAKDPLQRYKTDLRRPRTIVVPSSPLRRASRAVMGGHLDLGSFLLGVDVSLRDCDPKMAQGLFGPLTNSVGIRVNLSSCPTFADLVVALGKSLQLARKHGHFPFSTIAEEVGLVRGLPIKFSFLHHRDIVQITNPDSFYFPETAVGVEGHGLARLGSTCYLTPLSSKMDDTCYFELLLWESYEGESVGGGFRYQPQTIRTELVEAFGSELCRLLVTIAEDPCRPLLDLASLIRPPFLSSSRMRSRKH